MYYFDGHCDTLSKALDTEKDLYDNDLQFSFKRAIEIGGGIQVMACFVDTEILTQKNAGFNRCDNILKKFEEYQKKNKCNILIKNKNDLENALNSNDIRVILSIENGSAISGNLDNIDYFYNKGVRIMSITWNYDNELGCGAKTKNDTGLTSMGVEYVRKLNELGIVIDVSHLSEKSFWDVISVSTKPVVATHSNVYNLCENPRNLRDNQIKAIAKSGGMVGICFYSDFLNENRRADVDDIIEHINYIEKLVGIDYVGLGSDFDGVEEEHRLEDIKGVKNIHILINELYKYGYKKEDVDKITSKNFVRVAKQIL